MLRVLLFSLFVPKFADCADSVSIFALKYINRVASCKCLQTQFFVASAGSSSCSPFIMPRWKIKRTSTSIG